MIYPAITPETQGFVFPALVRVLDAFGFGGTSHDTARNIRDAYLNRRGLVMDLDEARQFEAVLYEQYGENKDRYIDSVSERARSISPADWGLFCNTLFAAGPAMASQVYSRLIDHVAPRS